MRDPAASAVAKLNRLEPHLGLDGFSKTIYDQVKQALLLLPMKDVLTLVGGETVDLKRVQIPVSRNTWYSWWSGQTRPNRAQALKLQQLTNIPAEKFQGRR